MDKPPSHATLLLAVGPLLGLSVLGWGLILWAVANMGAPLVALTMPMGSDWAFAEITAVSVMWSVMMAAMMLPSAIPMLVAKRRFPADGADTGLAGGHGVLTGYLAAWTLFSLASAGLHWGFLHAGVLSPMVKLQDASIAGAILILAGVFQLTPYKMAALSHCRRPTPSLPDGWRPGQLASMRIGFAHGLCCIACCWALMLVLFVGGAMSLPVIFTLTLAVAVEKLAPNGVLLARLGALPLIGWGMWLAVGS